MLELDAQGAHFWSAVEAQQFAPFSRRVITECLDRPEPAQCHEGQKQKDTGKTVKASRQVKVLGRMPQQPADQERRQSQQDAAFRNVESAGKARSGLLQLPKARRPPLQRSGRAAPHWRGTIGFCPLALGAGCRRLCAVQRRLRTRCAPLLRRTGRNRSGTLAWAVRG